MWAVELEPLNPWSASAASNNRTQPITWAQGGHLIESAAGPPEVLPATRRHQAPPALTPWSGSDLHGPGALNLGCL